MSVIKKTISEFIGTAFLLAVVVGSGIMGENLSPGNLAITLLANTIATGTGLAVLILSFEHVSGAHFNPAVTFTECLGGRISRSDCSYYLAAQITGAIVGVGAANLMFEKPMYFLSEKIRHGNAQFLSEFIATFGLIMVIRTGMKFRPAKLYFMVGAYITAAYWFTASTSFANPAVTIARSLSDTFVGIHYKNVPMFVIAQLFGAISAMIVFDRLLNDQTVKQKG